MESPARTNSSVATDSWFASVAGVDQPLDVPNMLADRIGELYASEERLQRRQRTNRLIREASHLIEE